MRLCGQWRGRIQAAILILGLFLVGVSASPPSWWGEKGVTTQDDPADYAAANQGQIKWLAVKAQEQFDAMLPGGAGAGIDDLTDTFSTTNNYLAVNLGQLKAVAAPFYDRLWDLSASEPYVTNTFPSGMAGTYPWSSVTSDDADYAMVNIGQVKYVFSFNLDDQDNDGLPDWWEEAYGLNPTSGVSSSLMAWWKFDEGSGTNVANATSTNYVGAMVNMDASNWVSGLLGSALVFDGTDEHVKVPQDPAVITGGQFTVSAWIWYDPLPGSQYRPVLSDLDNSYVGYWLGFDKDPEPDQLELFWGSSGGYDVIGTPDQSLYTNQWVHVAATCDGTTKIFYLNGAEMERATTPAFSPAEMDDLLIGADLWGGYWKGMIDDVRIYGSALASNQVASMYDALQDPDGDGLASYEEYQSGTDPLSDDSDSDGMLDGWEISKGFDPLDPADALQDADKDLWTNRKEHDEGTDPFDHDTDGDYLADGAEFARYGKDPRLAQTDGQFDDFLTLGSQAGGSFCISGYSPDPGGCTDGRTAMDVTFADVEIGEYYDFVYLRDLVAQDFRVAKHGGPAVGDTLVWTDCGGPGYSPYEGQLMYAGLLAHDYDEDGLGAGFEVQFLDDCLPDIPDSNGNGVDDGAEDPDGDGKTNAEEYNHPDFGYYNGCIQGISDPLNPDSDGDLISDGPDDPDGPAGPIVAGPDAFPVDPAGSVDTDCDGKPNALHGMSNSWPPLEEDDDDDGDGLSDDDEINVHGTDPIKPDTDEDGFTDYEEIVVFRSDPNQAGDLPVQYPESSRTVYYGHPSLTASEFVYSYSISLYDKVTMGKGWIVSDIFVPDLHEPSDTVYYGQPDHNDYPDVFVHSRTVTMWNEVDMGKGWIAHGGFITDFSQVSSAIYYGKPDHNGHNDLFVYGVDSVDLWVDVEMGKGWVTAGGFEPNLDEPSQQIWYTRPDRANNPTHWVYTYDFRVGGWYDIGKGWLRANSPPTYIPDLTEASRMVYYGLPGEEGSSDEFIWSYSNNMRDDVMLGTGWATPHGLLADLNVTTPPIYHGIIAGHPDKVVFARTTIGMDNWTYIGQGWVNMQDYILNDEPSPDTDGDGRMDGYDPFSPEAPATPDDSHSAQMVLTVGDDSGSHTELYGLHVGPGAVIMTHISLQEFLFWGTFSVPRGTYYEDNYLESLPDPDGDGDYFASVGGQGIVVDDYAGVLGSQRDTEFNSGKRYFDVFVPRVDIVAHKPGTRIEPGAAVSKVHESMAGVILACVNNDNDDGGASGSHDYDDEYIGANDNDVIKLTLKKFLPDELQQGTLELTIEPAASAVRIFKSVNNVLDDHILDLSSPLGNDLYWVTQGDLDLYVEVLEWHPEITIKLAYKDASGIEVCSDRALITIIKVDIAMDGNRDDTIDFDDPEDEEYLFWVNDDFDNEHHNEGMWQQDDQAGDADANDDYIGNSEQSGVNGCERDLEDFTRLHLFVDDNTTTLPGITYHLKFENVTAGSPSVNIFDALDTGTDYLSDESLSASQIQEERIITVGTTEVELDAGYILPGDQPSPFLLEGKSVGTGDLTFIIKVDGNEVCTQVVTLELHDMPWFYDVYSVGVSSGTRWEVQIPTTATHSQTASYSPATAEKFLLVHGWNMDAADRTRWIQTVFKRLWWQGYQGSVALFDWPTLSDMDFWDVLAGAHHFDNSEFRSWLSADALAGVFNTLNGGGNLRVLAHSMGNVVTGEAIRQYTGANLHTYLACQAALSAHFYDNTIAANHPCQHQGYDLFFPNTPDIMGHFSTGDANSNPYMTDNDAHVSNVQNYFNPDDWALDFWEINNVLKPDGLTPYLFGYDGSENQYVEGTDQFSRGPIANPYEILSVANQRQRYMIFSYCDESRSRALGQTANGEFSDWNLNEAFSSGGMGYDDEHYSHSREFRSHIAAEWRFWERVFDTCSFENP